MSKETFAALFSNESLTALPWGIGGGAVAAIVLKAHPVEMLGRIFVGGVAAAALAPYLATEVLNMNTSSPAYPFLCCSVGILGYQLVRTAIEKPERLPIVGAFIAKYTTAAVPPEMAAEAHPAAPLPMPPPRYELPPPVRLEPPRPRFRVPPPLE
ncbi:hypothetical protein [uncultured Hyphomicrobium sp.]|uniref:hypothetical protein n=1 Tax=uncultured Hyphomicrobium sp. TaxID=194373 RepID=UPI0025F10D10|nr:hypothetical protein [uncultured Hyphomicrobium sp.]